MLMSFFTFCRKFEITCRNSDNIDNKQQLVKYKKMCLKLYNLVFNLSIFFLRFLSLKPSNVTKFLLVNLGCWGLLTIQIVKIAWIFIFLIFFFPSEDPTFLSFRRGDVLYIIKDGEYNIKEGWIKARNERTSQIGAVSLDSILILPMLTRPTEETLVNMISLVSH